MAQAALDAGRVPPRDRLVVVVDALESMIMRERQVPVLGPVIRREARRTRRDELCCLQAASHLAYVSEVEEGELGSLAAAKTRLDLILPPAKEPSELEDPVAVFVGDRMWRPNADALSKLIELWPRISRLVPNARLLIAGRPGRFESVAPSPSVERVGYVDRLDDVWARASVLLAPVTIGGGVRVKVLDASRHGVPVVATRAAIGSTDRYLPLQPAGSWDEFVDTAVELLRNRDVRAVHGEKLYTRVRELSQAGFLERQIEPLLLDRATLADAEDDSARVVSDTFSGP
jgi:glycosyltransferase involved in cell wall biosynthesis